LRPFFGLTLFVGAGLLFLVEPMFAKMVLPLAGGSPEVWNTCLVFFQAALLAGYAWAHFVSDRLSPRIQLSVQCVLLALPLALLPFHLPLRWIPPPGRNPIPWIFMMALMTVGPAFFVLSTITPLLQRWYADGEWAAGADPYPLYQASNLGSLVALVSYPFFFEPFFGLSEQGRVWAWGYGALVVLVFACAAVAWTHNSPALASARVDTPAAARFTPTAPSPPGAGGAPSDITPIPLRERLRWILLAFVPSSLLLGVTLAVTTDLPPIPLLWIVPLVIYLGTFILVFAERPLLPQRIFVQRMPVLVLVVVFLSVSHAWVPAFLLLALNWLTFFVAAMVCHGELARRRPPARQLTTFYLCLAIGGVLGGVFNALLAPLIFHSVLEYPLVLVVAALCRPRLEDKMPRPASGWVDLGWAAGLGALSVALLRAAPHLGTANQTILRLVTFLPPLLLCLSFGRRPQRFALGAAALVFSFYGYVGPFGANLFTGRSYFGVYRVEQSANGKQVMLIHGSTIHGIESLEPTRRDEPLGYYTRTGPVGQIFAALDDSGGDPAIAVAGLGTGGLAVYARPGQPFTFYEIDPLVVRLARDPRYFTFLRDSPGAVRVVVGDGRLSLAAAPPHSFRLIVLDAFTSDAVPVHLLTRQAVSLYLTKLTPHGFLAFNVSNRYLDLEPVLANLAQSLGLAGWIRNDTAVSPQEIADGKFASQWVVLARRPADVASLASDPRWQPLHPRPSIGIWTDDYSDLVGIVRWK
jgi:hypothetical protein